MVTLREWILREKMYLDLYTHILLYSALIAVLVGELFLIRARRRLKEKKVDLRKAASEREDEIVQLLLSSKIDWNEMLLIQHKVNRELAQVRGDVFIDASKKAETKILSMPVDTCNSIQ